MEGGLAAGLQQLAPTIVALLVIASLALLWRQSRSAWLVVALVAEIASFAFRGVLIAMPDLARTMPLFFAVWTLTSLAFAIGLLGYAIEATQKRAP